MESELKKGPPPGLNLMRGGYTERVHSVVGILNQKETFQPSLAFISASMSAGSGT